MTTYYIDSVNGSDSNNGLGPDASAVTNKPWKTIAKALGASGMASGDTAYLSPAGPFREVVTVAMTSPTVETKIVGDPANAQGFKTSGGALVASGPVVWTAYTTNDTTAPSGSPCLSLATRNHLTFQYIAFQGGTGNPSCVSTGTGAHDLTFRDCFFSAGPTGSNNLFQSTTSPGVACNHTFDRCIFAGGGGGSSNGSIQYSLALHTADYNINVTIQNCLFIANLQAIRTGGTGSGSGKAGGFTINNCTFWAQNTCVQIADASFSTTFPMAFIGCFFFSNQCLSANTLGQITEDYCVFASGSPRSNVNTGTHSKTTYSPLLQLGQELFFGQTLRPAFSPVASSPLLAFGGTSGLTVDLANRRRPAGGAGSGLSVGAYERHNSWGQETGTVRTGSNAISITGPGDHDFNVPVDNGHSHTLTVYVRWDSTYAGTKPQMQIVNGEEAGVAAATATATGSANNWEQLTLSFTPTANGVVTVRIVSNDTNGAGHAYADDLQLT